jgi:A/G-specific adenine glycosylase
MAQQTRLETMLPYYKRWMNRFPTIKSLANSTEQDVLRVWEGLGYYSRARNLRRAALIIVDRHKGSLPKYVDALMNLPGIGRYTAGAIASMAFGQDEPVVDGNVIRVLARVFNVKHPVGSSRATNHFWALAAEHLPLGRAADYNQALMDLGASLCKPRQPDCSVCPLRNECRAFALGVQQKRPVKNALSRVPTRYFATAVIRKGNQVLVLQRPARGLLARMWEFPNEILGRSSRTKTLLRRNIRTRFGFDLDFSQDHGHYQHAYSHFTADYHVFSAKLNGAKPQSPRAIVHRWVPVSNLGKLPMGKLDRLIANSLRDNGRKK